MHLHCLHVCVYKYPLLFEDVCRQSDTLGCLVLQQDCTDDQCFTTFYLPHDHFLLLIQCDLHDVEGSITETDYLAYRLMQVVDDIVEVLALKTFVDDNLIPVSDVFQYWVHCSEPIPSGLEEDEWNTRTEINRYFQREIKKQKRYFEYQQLDYLNDMFQCLARLMFYVLHYYTFLLFLFMSLLMNLIGYLIFRHGVEIPLPRRAGLQAPSVLSKGNHRPQPSLGMCAYMLRLPLLFRSSP